MIALLIAVKYNLFSILGSILVIVTLVTTCRNYLVMNVLSNFSFFVFRFSFLFNSPLLFFHQVFTIFPADCGIAEIQSIVLVKSGASIQTNLTL